LRADAPDGAAGAIHVGIGINAGDMVLGAIGHKDRMDFTVIGDAVNLGARLCSAAKGGQVILSTETVAAIGEAPELRFEPLEPIAVKGKKEPIDIVLARRAPA